MGHETQKQEQKVVQFAADEQTGNVFELKPERRGDIEAATVSIIYLIAMLIFFMWQFVDISTGQMLLLKWILDQNANKLNSDISRIIAYAVIGGGLGGVINGFRSILIWHADRRAFGWRYLWKYITLPLVGTALAAIVYASTRAGITVIGGNIASGDTAGSADFMAQAFSAFAIGAASGYGSPKVFKWLDELVNRIFKISEIAEVEVPELKGKTKEEVQDILRASELSLGQTMERTSSNASEIDTVVDQRPLARIKVPKASSVDIIIAKEAVVEVIVPNLKDKTEQEAKDVLEKLELKYKEETQDSSDAKVIGKVIEQSPSADTKVTKGSEVTITIAKQK